MNTRAIAGRILSLIDREDRIRKLRSFYIREAWLRRVSNIVHVGANSGQEAAAYAERNLGVLWIEPIPSVFQELQKNISRYPNQTAYQALVTDRASQLVTLHIASNEGASSSIFDLAEHKEIWPEVDYVGSIDVLSHTLDDILLSDSRQYDGLVMDTQGSELLVLKGASTVLQRFKYIKTEAADFEMYKGAATCTDLINFLSKFGFRLVRRDLLAKKPHGLGQVVDLLFKQE
jgi:2-O-methyltransferase